MIETDLFDVMRPRLVLQYRLPAVNDVLLQEYRDSEPLLALCHAGTAFHDSLVAEGHAASVLVRDLKSADALALEHGGRPPRADYDRRTAFVVGGICTSRRDLHINV